MGYNMSNPKMQGVDPMLTKPPAKCCEKCLKLRDELLAVEADRSAGCPGTTLDELDSYLEWLIDEVAAKPGTSL